MRILLVEPWFHGSHRQWAEGYRRASAHRVDIVSLPGGRWRWLLRGGAQALADAIERDVAEHGPPELLLVSGMVDVAHLLGLTRRCLPAAMPTAIYQHESQLVYPGRRAEEQEAALRNWLSWCAADLVVFNSDHHRAEVEAALPSFLDRLPEPSPRPHLDSVLARFDVLPVGVEVASLIEAGARARAGRAGRAAEGQAGPPVVLWPHRWERDKDPDAFEAALAKVEAAGLEVRVILAGEDPPGGSRYVDEVRNRVADRFRHLLDGVGPFDRDHYRELLTTADLVVSCANHEFFGIGVVEAVAAGCRPVLPAALSYPELIPRAWHETSLYQPGRFGTALVDAVRRPQPSGHPEGLADSMMRFDLSVVAERYDRRFEQLVAETA